MRTCANILNVRRLNPHTYKTLHNSTGWLRNVWKAVAQVSTSLRNIIQSASRSGCDRCHVGSDKKMSYKDKEREFLAECIDMYRRLPVLWQVKNKLYHDRDKKNAAYDVLLAKYNEMFPQATKEDLKKKINSLRTNYRKELKKYMDSVNSGASDDSIYVPTLWYFGEFHFLRDQELPLDMDVHKNVKKRPKIRASIEEKQDALNIATSPQIESKYTPKKAKTDEPLIDISHERLTEAKDEYHHWGMACAADLQKMERTQQIYAKKAIAEILMEGQLGLLHRHSVKINENSAAQLRASPSP